MAPRTVDIVKTFRATAASTVSHDLAEGPVWDAAAQRLLWVDIPRGRVLWGRLDGDQVRVTGEHGFAGTAGAVVPPADGGLLIALRRGLATIAADGTVRQGRAVVPEDVDSRFNDGACDPAGRFLVGSMALDDRRGGEHLYRVDADAGVEVLDGDLTLSNGLGWSPDGTTLYHVDSVPGVVWTRSYDVASEAIGPRRELLRITNGTPDGLCVDADGNLWIAIWGGGEIRCFTPGGEQIAAVEVPAPHTTSAAFVGPGLDRLLITTARKDLSSTDLMAWPLSGRLFVADVGARGLATVPWAGRCDQMT
jgi:sugar lactone lactonase YvrE